jgi:AcrR family transcriptional regulator
VKASDHPRYSTNARLLLELNRDSLLVAMAYRATQRTEARRLAARERILTAAHDLVAHGGFGAAQVAPVAAKAGVATGTVYRHFASKADLFAEVFRRAAQREVDAVARASDLPGAVETFARRALAGRRLAWALLAEPVDPVVEAERLAFRRAYRDAFERLVGDPLTSAALVGAIGEVLVGPLSPTGPDLDEDALVRDLVSICQRLGEPDGR